MNRRWLVTAVTLIAAPCLFASGCERAAAPELPPPPVTVATPEVRTVQKFLEFTGRTEAAQTVQIRARVRGFLKEVHFRPSQDVVAGDLLFTIDPAPYQAALDKAKADLARAEAKHRQARWDFDRVQDLVSRNAANDREIQDATAALELALAEKQAAQAAVDTAQLDLDYTTVESPVDGQVARSLVDVGNLVGAGDNTLLTTVTNMDPIYAYFTAGEDVVLRYLDLRARGEVEEPIEREIYLGLGDSSDFPYTGYADFIDNTVDPDTGTIQIRGRFENEEWDLYPGLFARVRVPGREIEDAILVREDAIGSDMGGKYVFIVDDDNIVHRRYVTLGQLTDDGYRVVEAGIETGERYVINGLARARPGLPVRVETMANETAASNASESTDDRH